MIRCWLKIFALWLLLLSSAFSAQPPAPEGEPPLPPSPIDEFRQWLHMTPPKREKELHDWPQDKRIVLRDKLRAYEQLSPEERERRLRMLELRWYLRPLMSAPVDQRERLIKTIPGRLHALVLKRLKEWDTLPTETQKEILQNEEARELVTRYFAQVRQGRTLAPEQRADLEK